jgi:phosphomannomutase
MEIFFGTDGWRGLLDSEVNERSVALVAQAFADYALSQSLVAAPKIAVGYDGRRNSREFAHLFASVLDGNGIGYLLSDRVIPTPALSYTVHALGLDHGVMITASHNPPEYNGIKFKAAYGGPFFTEQTHSVEALIGSSPVKNSIKELVFTDLLTLYKEQIRRFVDLKNISESGIAVLTDSMSGAGGTVIQDLLDEYGLSSGTIYGIPDASFSGRLAEPIEKNLLPLREALQRGNYSLGVATDGDADRLGVLLENGDWLSSQETILLLADYLKNGKKLSGDIVKTSSVTNLLSVHFASADCTVHDVQVGFKYICEAMMNTKAAFGAEESGGYGFRGHIPERDGILSALLFMEMLAVSPYRKLSEYVRAKRKQFGEIFYDRIDHPYHNSDRVEILPALELHPPSTVAGFPVTQRNSFFSSRGIVNGLKLHLDGKARWLLLRSSETEPLIRIYAEGESHDEVQRILRAGIALVTR